MEQKKEKLKFESFLIFLQRLWNMSIIWFLVCFVGFFIFSWWDGMPASDGWWVSLLTATMVCWVFPGTARLSSKLADSIIDATKGMKGSKKD